MGFKNVEKELKKEIANKLKLTNSSELAIAKLLVSLSGFTLAIIGALSTQSEITDNLSGINKTILISGILLLLFSLIFAVLHYFITYNFWLRTLNHLTQLYKEIKLIDDDTKRLGHYNENLIKGPMVSKMIFLWVQVGTYFLGTILVIALLIGNIIK